jgi:ABC-type multidrug transport system fused ATPase/permease subunit
MRNKDLSIIVDSLSLLESSDKRKLGVVSLTQFFLGILDLFGVAIIGVLGSLAVSGIQSKAPGNRVGDVLEFLNLENFAFQMQVAILGTLAVLLLIFRTIVSIILIRRTLLFLSHRGAEIGSKLFERLLAQEIVVIENRSIQQNSFALLGGVNSITVGIIGTLVTLFADLSLMAIMIFGLLLVDPMIALQSLIIFGGAGLLLYRLLSKKVRNLGRLEADLNIALSENIFSTLQSYREFYVRNQLSDKAVTVNLLRKQLATVLANNSFYPNIGKYLIEVSIIFGSLVIGATQFIYQDANRAVATLAVFMAAGTRIGPGVLRAQQGMLTIKNSLGAATVTVGLYRDLIASEKQLSKSTKVMFDYPDFVPTVNVQDLSFYYPNSELPALKGLNFSLKAGSRIAIVGPSGSGKSTLADVLLGVVEPTTGSIQIAGMSPREAIQRWPGGISYVPQKSNAVRGSIKENIYLECLHSEPANLYFEKSLKAAELEEVFDLSGESNLGDSGSKLSGGQLQRLGIARALFTNPKLIVLDEATSALDGATEFRVSEAIQELEQETTVVVIAHRLSTVRHSDLVIYLNKGQIVASGSFESVRKLVPDFDKQAELMGL